MFLQIMMLDNVLIFFYLLSLRNRLRCRIDMNIITYLALFINYITGHMNISYASHAYTYTYAGPSPSKNVSFKSENNTC